MSDNYPGTTPTLLNKINFDGMTTEYGNNIILGTIPKINKIDTHTKPYLLHLSYITQYLPDHYKPIPLDEYLKYVKQLR